MRGNKGLQICHEPFSQLPKEVIVEILLRTSSVKTIALCKSVCKYWRGLISDPLFVELHLARSKICALVTAVKRTLRTVWLLEDEDGHRGFNSGHCICGPGTEMESCEICLSDVTAVTELKFPVVQVGPLWGKPISNTCNGLLCMYGHNYGYTEDSPIVVCNPITGEFIFLPNPERHMDNSEIEISVCGLGLDQKTGRYKVVMLYSLPKENSKQGLGLVVLKAVVHELGTDSWRELDTPDIMLDLYSTYMSGPALLDGALYWVYRELSRKTYGMVFFDLDSESLRYCSLSSPPPRDEAVIPILAVVVLGGQLCVYPSYSHGKLDMCVVAERSASDSSAEWISHDLSEVQDDLQLICSLDDGALLMFHGRPGYELVYYDPSRGGPRFKRMMFADGDRVEVVAYTPSFISLEDIVGPRNAEVHNVY